MNRIWLISGLLAIFPAPAMAGKLVIHEWGTFTALQNERGEAIGGINSDDEPLPGFVHSLPRPVIGLSGPDRIAGGGKGVPFMHPDITMRLETPVIYFYPPESAALPLELDIAVQFRGGWLTQYYPYAVSTVEDAGESNRITSSTTGRLDWPRLRVGDRGAFPPTDSGIWLAPRAVRSAPVTVASGKDGGRESEQYLFYRGVGQLDAPVRVVRADARLVIRSGLRDCPVGTSSGSAHRCATAVPAVNGGQHCSQSTGTPLTGQPLSDSFPAGPLKAPGLWLVEIRTDGRAAFRSLGPVTLTRDRSLDLAAAPAEFRPEEFGADHLDRLREQMHRGLVEDGLFADEATAMLKTWEGSYFKSPGLRLFYLVPKAWIEYHLPLEVSIPAEVKRVMIGRTEIVTPRQRELLEAAMTRMNAADPQVRDDGREAFLKLGRFRDALLLDARIRLADQVRGVQRPAPAVSLRSGQEVENEARHEQQARTGG